MSPRSGSGSVAELARLEAEAAALQSRIERQERELSRVKTSHRSTLIRERSVAAPPATNAFADPEEEVRWQVYSAWVHRIPAGEKATRPLGAFSIGPAFLKSLGTVEGIAVEKVAGVVVEVLTGLAESNPSRGMHALRSGAGGQDPQVRSDGATCWRVSLQTGTPSTALLEVGKRHRTVAGRAARRLPPLSAASGDHPLQKLPSHGVMTAQSVAR